jgi:hypothetical protein
MPMLQFGLTVNHPAISLSRVALLNPRAASNFVQPLGFRVYREDVEAALGELKRRVSTGIFEVVEAFR